MLNQNPNTFTFNGHSSDEFGIRIERKPDLNRSGRKYKSATVNGRNGNIYQLQDAWDEVTVAYHIYAGGRDKGDVLPAFTDIMEWLNSADDYAVLTDSYDPEHYRLAVFVDSTDIESQWYTIGEATIKFRCRPQRFLATGELDLDDMSQHETGEIVSIEGDGSAFQRLAVNIEPIQSGSGDPSPSNIRPISGTSSVNVYLSPTTSAGDATTITAALGTTVYGGTADIISGTGKKTMLYTDLGNLNWAVLTTSGKFKTLTYPAGMKTAGRLVCSHYKGVQTTSVSDLLDGEITYTGSEYGLVIYDASKASMSAAQFKAAMSGVKLCYEVAYPSSYTFTAQPTDTLVGQNNVWSDEGTVEVMTEPAVNNPTNHTALPIITLTGSEIVTSMLDLEKPYDIALDVDGRSWYSEWLTDIAFVEVYGTNETRIETYRTENATAQGGVITTKDNATGTLTFTPFRDVIIPDERYYDVGLGRGITLTPDTTYTISCNTTSGDSKIWVGFFESEGYQMYNSSAIATRSGAGLLYLRFRVPANCSNVLIIFYRTDNTAGTFSSIMLSSGTTVLPFFPYNTEATEFFTLNDITLSFTTSGFDTAVIDCEKENFTVDGVNYNNKSTVLDQYGNISTEYLRLQKGKNTLTFSSDITDVKMDPKLWNL